MSKTCTPLWCEAHFQVKIKKHTRFGPLLEVEMSKKCAVVARSTFPSQNVQSTPFSDHFWQLRCRKSARRCGAKHISKWNCIKHHMFAPLLEVQMSNKCMPLWREAHFEINMLKTPGVRTTFGGSDVASLRFTTIHYTSLHYTPLHYITLHYTPQHYNYNYNYTTTQLHSTTYITLHDTALPSTTLHYITLNYTPQHYITLHYTLQHYNYNYTTTLHYTPLH